MENFSFIEHDVQDHIEIEDNVDYVLHFASAASPKAYTEHPVNTLKAGSVGTINTLGLAKKHSAEYLLASTSEVYGDTGKDVGLLKVDSKILPSNPYGASKAAMIRLSKSLAIQFSSKNIRSNII